MAFRARKVFGTFEKRAIGPVVQTMDSAIRMINHYPVDKSTKPTALSPTFATIFEEGVVFLLRGLECCKTESIVLSLDYLITGTRKIQTICCWQYKGSIVPAV